MNYIGAKYTLSMNTCPYKVRWLRSTPKMRHNLPLILQKQEEGVRCSAESLSERVNSCCFLRSAAHHTMDGVDGGGAAQE